MIRIRVKWTEPETTTEGTFFIRADYHNGRWFFHQFINSDYEWYLIETTPELVQAAKDELQRPRCHRSYRRFSQKQ